MSGIDHEDAKALYQHALEIARNDLRSELLDKYSGGDVLNTLSNLSTYDPDFDEQLAVAKKAICIARARNSSQDEINRLILKLGEIMNTWLEHGMSEYVSAFEEDRALEYMSKKVR